MKTKKNFALLIACTTMLLCACGGANNNSQNGESGNGNDSTSQTQQATLDSIAITTAPTKVAYVEGESFNPAGMVVTGTYSDQSTKAITDYTYSPNGALALTDTKVVISYEGKSAEQAITVSAKQAQVVMTFYAEDKSELHFYDNNKVILMEGTDYATPIDYSVNKTTGEITFTLPAGIEGYLQLTAYAKNGKMNVSQVSMGNEVIYSLSLKEYKALLNIPAAKTLEVSNANGSFVLYDIGTFERKVGQNKEEGEFVYTDAVEAQGDQEAVPASLVLKVKDKADESLVLNAQTNIWATGVEDLGVADAQVKYAIGYFIGAIESEKLSLFFEDGSNVQVVVDNGSLAQFARTYTYDNSDLLDIKLTIADMIVEFGGVTYAYFKFTCTYDADEDVMNIKCNFSKDDDTKFAEVSISGTDLDDLLAAAFVETAIVTVNASAGKNAKMEDLETAPTCELRFFKAKLEMYIINDWGMGRNETLLASGAWQADTTKYEVGYSLSGQYVKNSFTYGSVSFSSLNIVVDTANMSTIGQITYTLTGADLALLFANA